jgi:hypothetical protein
MKRSLTALLAALLLVGCASQSKESLQQTPASQVNPKEALITQEKATALAKQVAHIKAEVKWQATFDSNREIEGKSGSKVHKVWVVEAVFWLGNKEVFFIDAMSGEFLGTMSVGHPQPTTGSNPANAPTVNTQARPRGILNRQQGPFGSQYALVENAWQDTVDGVWVQVFAGHLTQESKQGVVIVNVLKSDLDTSGPLETFKTPTASGSVRIVAADGTKLTLKAADGKTWVFDVAARQYLSMK